MSSGLAPYHSRSRYCPLRRYLERGLSAPAWAEEQFQLEISHGGAQDSVARPGAEQAILAMDGLPLQVKDILRGLIERVHLQPASCFDIDELGCWRQGELRINCEPGRVASMQGWVLDGGNTKQMLQTTFIHESGHALVEDPRGGVPLRDFVCLLAASGWLPHPLADPEPFRGEGMSPSELTEYMLGRLRQIDPRWDPSLPAGSPLQPPQDRLDLDLMGPPGSPNSSTSETPRSLGLRGPRQLSRELLTAAARGGLDSDLGRLGLNGATVRRVADRFRPVSSYAEDLISETPAEVFRQLHRGRSVWVDAALALEVGDRVLIQPWRMAELERGRPEPAPGPHPRTRQFSLRR